MSFANYSLTIERKDDYGFSKHVIDIDLPGIIDGEEAVKKAEELNACLKDNCIVSLNMGIIKTEIV